MYLIFSFANLITGLAIVPTWIALREHIPIEADKKYGYEDENERSEEEPSTSVGVISKEKNVLELATGQNPEAYIA